MMIFLEMDSNIRTRTDFHYKVEFGRVLENTKSLFSISFYGELEVKTLNFIDRTYSVQGYDKNRLISSLNVFKLGENMPVISTEINSKINDEGLIEISTSPLGNHGQLMSIDESVREFYFGRVHSFLGYETNCYFGFMYFYEKGEVVKSQLMKRNIKLGTEEILSTYSHEYQFRNTEVENLAEEILSNGWNQEKVNNLLSRYKSH